MSSYRALCWRDGPGWAVCVPTLGATTMARRLPQVQQVARSLVASRTGEDPGSCRVAVSLVARHSLSELLAAAAALRRLPDEMSVEAVTMRRSLAERLSAEGFSPRDVAGLLGLSYRRALQLAGGRPHRRIPAPAGPAVPVQRAPAPATGAGRPVHGEQHSSYRHEAVWYRGRQDFLDQHVPFVREGLDLGQPVMVAVVPERLTPLRAALGADADRVYWVDMSELGANPARIIPAWRQFVDEHAADGRPVRGIGEPVWAGRPPAELAECQLHEALLNLAVEPDTPLWLRCPYDVTALDAEVLAEAVRSHPVVVDGPDYRGSTTYGGADHAGSLLERGLPEPDPSVPVEAVSFGSGTVDAVRSRVLARAVDSGLDGGRAADLVLAVTEAATNSVRHAGGQGELRIWQDDEGLRCEVRDDGHVEDPLAGRRLPSLTAEGGRGLWMVNQLSDLAQLRSSAEGTAVRVLARL